MNNMCQAMSIPQLVIKTSGSKAEVAKNVYDGVDTCCPEKLKSDLIQNQACSPYAIAWLPLNSLGAIGDLRFEYTSARRTFQLYSAGFTSSIHISILSHELPSLPKTNTKCEDSGNVTGLKSKLILVLHLVLVVQSKGS